MGVYNHGSNMAKSILKQKAIQLRRKAHTYSEIQRIVPVAKSTISLWLREVGLSVPQKQMITQKRIEAQRRGAQAQKEKRMRKQIDLITGAQKEIGMMTNRELWLVGIALYWAEGGKEKENRPGCPTSFSNSDPAMVALFLRWLKECVQIKDEDVHADLYIHESHSDSIEEVLRAWGNILSMNRSFFRAVYFKRNKIHTKRKNVGILYIGLIRVTIRSSSDLNRRITGWIKGITAYWGIV